MFLQAFAEPAQQADGDATQTASQLGSNASALLQPVSAQQAASLGNPVAEQGGTDTHAAGAQQPTASAATIIGTVQSPGQPGSGHAAGGDELFPVANVANEAFALEQSNSPGQQDGKLMSLLMD